jgi:hypothetical protein
MGDTRIDYSILMRPTRRRLLTAMGIATFAIAVLLASLDMLVDFAANYSDLGIEFEDPLTVHIRNGRDEPVSNLATDDQIVRPPPQEKIDSAEVAKFHQEAAPPDSRVPPADLPPADSPPVRDWRLIAGKAAKEIVDDQFRQEKSRASMWRQSYSVMFQPGDEIAVKQEKPILADIRFIPQIHVLGIGLTIGSCFIGIPIAGVPVEQRNVAMTFFVCAQDSG